MISLVAAITSPMPLTIKSTVMTIPPIAASDPTTRSKPATFVVDVPAAASSVFTLLV
jgi:hypothetical protein